MAVYKRYPSPADFDRVSREIVQKYPFMRNPISDHVSDKLYHVTIMHPFFIVGSHTTIAI